MNNETKQTAVEWLISQLQKTRDWQRVINESNQSSSSVRDVVQQAKEMEKEQMIECVTFGQNNHSLMYSEDLVIAKEYYNETYEGNK